MTQGQLPFKYGDVIDEESFVNRKEDISQLHNNFKSGISTVLISPRRWGKTSLVKKAAASYKKTKTKFVFIDCFRISTKQQFLEEFATKVISATSTKTDEHLAAIANFFKGVIPEIGLSTDINSEISFKLKWKNSEPPENNILDLPEKIASKKGIKIIICIDEFQNIATFDKDNNFQKVLRSYWQHHKNVTYCLYGSKRHVMTTFFNKSSMPFFRFGDILFLKKIKDEHWVPFICSQFKLHKKRISKNQAKHITQAVDQHSYYVQQLSHIVFIRTTKSVDNDILNQSLKQLLEQNQIMYQRIIEDLSHTQIEFLRALVDGVTSFYSKKVSKEYDLGTVGNIKRIKEALENKDVIDYYSKHPTFVDPVFKLWFSTYYLNRPLFALDK